MLMETIKPIYRSSNDDNHSFDEKYSQRRTTQIGDSRERHLNEIGMNRAYLNREKLL